MNGNVIDATLRFVDKFTGPMADAVKKIENNSKSIQRAGRNIEQTGDNISNVGSSFTTMITLPLATAAAGAIAMSNKFEDSMAKVSTIADTTTTPIDTLKKQVLDLSNATGVGATDVAEAQYQAISAGVETAKSVDFVGTAIKAAKGGFSDATTAVDGLTTVLNAYGKSADDASQISDQMLTAQNYGKTTFGDLASSMGNVIPIASNLNVSTEELFSSIAVLTKNGIATSESVTGLKAAYSNILKPTADAADAAENIGLNFSSSHLKSVGWVKFLQEIKEKTGGNAETMAKLFGSTEALNTVMVLAGKGSGDLNEAMGKMANSSGATQAAYEKMMTPSEKFNISINKLKNSLIKFGVALTPIFNKLTDVINKLGDKFNNLSDQQVNTIIKFAGIAAAVGPALFVFGKFTSGIGKTVLTVGKFGTAIGKGAKAFNKLSNVGKIGASFGKFGNIGKAAFMAITSPAGLVILAIAAIAVAAFLIIKNWTKVKAFLIKLGNYIKSIFDKSGVDTKKLVSAFQSAKDKISVIIEKLRPVINKIIAILKVILTFLKGAFIVALKVGLAAVVGVFSGIISGVSTVVNGVLNIINGIIDFITGVFTGDWKKAWTGVKEIFGGIFETLGGLLKTPINAVIGLINGAISGINKLGLTIPDWVPVLGGKSFSINIPTIPMLAKGTNYWAGGLAMTQERGGEIMDLPRGTRVYPHDQSISMAREEGTKSGRTINVTVEKIADAVTIQNDGDLDDFVKKFADKLEQIFNNTGEEVYA